MTRHPDRELLSAYLDGRLEVPRIRRIEDHLELCPTCRDDLEGLRSVIAALRGLERQQPPPALDLAVARRIRLEGRRPSLLERLENGLERLPRVQSLALAHLAVILSLATMLYLFADALERQRTAVIPVLFEDLPAAAASPPPPPPTLRPIDGVRYEPGLDPTTVIDERVVTGGERWHEVVRLRPELREVIADPAPAIVRVGSRVVAIHPSAS